MEPVEKTPQGRKFGPSLILGGAVAFILLLYFFTFTVRFDSICVVTTFDRASDESAVVKDPGLHLKWPYPIQDFQRYSRRVQTQEAVLEELATKDRKAVVVRSYVAWRVRDPLALFRTLRSEKEVRNQLDNRLRDAQSILGKYTFDELISPVPGTSKLGEAEKAIQTKLADDMKEPQDYGIEIVNVGIHRLEIHKQATPGIFNQMRKVREGLAQKARSDGSTTAQTIRSEAERDRDIIMAFANRHAENIRAEAFKNTVDLWKSFQQDESFAIYLNQLEALKKTLQRNTTFVLDTQTAPFDLFGKAKDEAPVQKKQ
jgi:membrane protease subunit HflC